MLYKRVFPAVLVLGMAAACSDQGMQLDSIVAPQFAVSPAPPSLDATILVGGPGDQIGLAAAVGADAVYGAGDDRAGGRHGLLVKFDLPLSAPAWSTVQHNTNFNGVAVSAGVAYTVGEALPPTCGASDNVGGTERKTIVARYDGSTGALLDCGSQNFFPYRGYEWFYAALAVPPYVYAGGNAEQRGFGRSSPMVIAKYPVSGGPYVAAVSEPGIVLGSYTGCCPGESQARGLMELGGDLYIVGFSRLPGHGEDNVKRPALMRYTSALARVWKVRPTDNAGGRFNGVAALGGDLYAVGENGSSGSRDFLVERYTTAGARIWTATSGGSGDDVLTGVVAVGGRLFAAGHTTSSGAGGADAVVMEIDPSTGAVIWTTHLGGAQDDRAHALVTDGSSLFAVGESRSYATPEGNTVGQNDLALWHLTLVVDVEIDIKPGSYPNSINLGAQGGIPVAIFSSPTFDATTIDPATVELAEAQIRIVGKGKLMVATEDVDGDGLMDLVVQMETSAFEATDGDTEAVLTGQTFDGICIRGVDTIRIVPPGDGGV